LTPHASQPAKLNYVHYKSPNHSPKLNLMVIHGMLGSSYNFRSIVTNSTITEKVNCILIDLRNHGDSEYRDSMTLDEMGNDVSKLIKDLKLDNLILMGYCLGGRVVMKTLLTYPELAKGAIIVDIMPINYFDRKEQFTIIEQYQKLVDNLSSLNLKRNIEEIKEEIGQIEKNKSFADYLSKYLVPDGKNSYRWRCNMKSLASYYREDKNECIRGENRYGGKVKVIAGSNSPFMDFGDIKQYENVFSNFSNQDIDVIEDAGHAIHAEKPDELVNSVSQFLSQFC